MAQPVEPNSPSTAEGRGKRLLLRWAAWVALVGILGVLGYFDFHLWYTLAFYGILGVLVIAQVIVFYMTRERAESHSAPKGPNISS